MSEIPGVPSMFLLPCSICSRTFRPEVLERHEIVCEKNTVKKRKVFSSFKARVQGTVLEDFLGPTPILEVPKPVEKPKPRSNHPPKWKQTHEALIATLKGARGDGATSTTKTSDQRHHHTTPMSSEVARDQCPTCGRHFGHKAFDRHVEFCRETNTRKARPPSHNDPAHLRMEARTKYRPPSFKGKSLVSAFTPKLPPPTPPSPAVQRRQSTPQRKVSQQSPPLNKSSPSALSMNRTPLRSSSTSGRPVSVSVTSLPSVSVTPTASSNSAAFARQGSLRIRNVSPTKNIIGSRTTRMSASPEKLPTTFKLKIGDKSNEVKQKIQEATNNSSGQTYSDSVDAIMATANKQMRALLSCSSSTDIAANSRPILQRSANSALQTKTSRVSPSPKTPLPSLPTPTSPRNSSPLHASPTSAFTPVLKNNENEALFDFNKNEMFVVGKNDWGACDSSTDFSTIPAMVTSTPRANPRTPAVVKALSYEEEHPSDQKTFTLRELERNRRNSAMSLSSQPSDSTLADEGILWSQLEALHPPAQLKKSRKKTFARSKSVFDDRNRMLFSLTCARKDSSSEEEEWSHPFMTPPPYEDDYSVRDKRKPSRARVKSSSVARRSESPHEDSKGRRSSLLSQNNLFAPRVPDSPVEDERHSSESRPNFLPIPVGSHSPGDDEEIQDGGVNMAIIGGGDSAYSSLTRRSPKSSDVVADSVTGPNRRMANFCQECGNKYTTPSAKFCCLCGVRRLYI